MMRKNLLKVLDAPWYFIPFAAYPVLAILAHNISQVRYTAGFRPLAISVAVAVRAMVGGLPINWRK